MDAVRRVVMAVRTTRAASPMPTPPLRRTLFVDRDLTGAREALDARARAGDDVTGWEPTTLRSIAADLARAALCDEGLVEGDDVMLVECSGEALDVAIADGELDAAQWAAHAAQLGFRDALHDAVLTLRAAGVDAATLAAVARGDAVRLLAVVLRRYVERLEAHGIADPARLIAVALREFDAEAPFALGDARIVLAAGLRPRGLLARLRDRLLAHGAEHEPPDDGGEAPLALDAAHAAAWTIARAASPDAEVRRVLRDAVAAGRPWDTIELAVTDIDTYATAVHAVCESLDVPVTIAAGLPFSRARLGRAMARWGTFIAESLDARTLWSALLEGDIALPTGQGTSAARVAHDLRGLGVGWGRERWDGARATLAGGAWAERLARPRHDGTTVTREEVDARAAAMVALIDAVITPLPGLPARGALTGPTTTAARLAAAALAWLELAVAAVDPRVAEEEAPIVDRIRRRLARLVELDHGERPPALALAVVQQALADVRWWPTWRGADGAVRIGPSRRSLPGALHVVELRDAGVTGRPVVALLGLDTERTGGGTAPEPFLGEALRRALNDALGHEALPLADARVREHRARLDWALVRCAGRAVSLSWCAVDGGRDAESTADPRVLDAARIVLGDPQLGHETLRERLGEPDGPVPLARHGAAPVLLDAREAWLHAIAGGAAWRDARAAVRAAWPAIGRAERHAEILAADASVPLADADLEPLGLVADFAAGGVSPFAGRRVSASELEALGTCPSRWFYRYLLRVRQPEDAEYEPFVWLDPRQRGTILHAVFEEVARRVIAGTLALHDPATDAAMRAIFREELAHEEAVHPAPSAWVRDAEAAELEEQLTAWLRAERAAGDGSDWHAVEQDLAGTTIAIGEHTVTVQGFIDRVDRTAAGYRIVDYKTTRRTDGYFGKDGVHFKGGRLVQPVFYRLAMAARTGLPVTEFAYRFPAGQAPHLVRRYHDDELAHAERTLLPTLAAHVAQGTFLPTDSADDCGLCDVGLICRVADDGWSPTSPRAAWTKARFKAGAVPPHLVPLQRRRAGEPLA